MDDRQRATTSKFLSLHLRHRPVWLGLTLEPGGWVGVDELLAACAAQSFPLRLDELREVVASSHKQRFSFDETGTRIRANQGHSVEIDLGLAEAAPPELLFHGTAERNVDSIMRDGLRRMARHHVHLSADAITARRVGSRHGRPVVLAVDAARMAADGPAFFVSDNGVWLTAEVPPGYIAEPSFAVPVDGSG